MIPFNEMLEVLVNQNGSDLFLSVGTYPYIKVGNQFIHLCEEKLEPGDTERIAIDLMDERQRGEFFKTHEMNLAFDIEGKGRFRTNIFMQRSMVSIVIRLVKYKIPTLESLGLPPILSDLITKDRGLILVTGATGSGKSTTIASMLSYRNHNRSGHIVTLEDPIEFVHFHQKSIVNQREVGMDTETFSIGLKNVLRQAPDVIVIGEIRDLETMESAMAYAETGHLVVSTLHSINAKQTLERVIQFFPDGVENKVLQQLSNVLIGIISQRLVPKKGGSRVAALEIMLASPRIRELIYKGELGDIIKTMERSYQDGMTTFDLSLLDLYNIGLLEREEALRASDNPGDLTLKMAGVTTGSMNY